MKKLIISLIVAGLMFGLVPQSQAINREWSAALGFLGGILVADSMHNHHQDRIVYRQPCYEDSYYCAPGHWEEIMQQRWVPGYWIEGRDRCGYPTQTWIEGYYIMVPVRVYRCCPHCGR